MTKDGAALPVVLLALAISSALAIGGAYASRRAAATARSRITLERLADAAETSIGALVASWDTTAMANEPVGQTTSASIATLEQETGTWVTRLTHSAYWVVAESCGLASPRVCRRQAVVIIFVSGNPIRAYGQLWADLP